MSAFKQDPLNTIYTNFLQLEPTIETPGRFGGALFMFNLSDKIVKVHLLSSIMFSQFLSLFRPVVCLLLFP